MYGYPPGQIFFRSSTGFLLYRQRPAPKRFAQIPITPITPGTPSS